MWGRKTKYLTWFGKSYLWQKMIILILVPHLPSYVGHGGRRPTVWGVWGGEAPLQTSPGVWGAAAPQPKSVYISLSGLVRILKFTHFGACPEVHNAAFKEPVEPRVVDHTRNLQQILGKCVWYRFFNVIASFAGSTVTIL